MNNATATHTAHRNLPVLRGLVPIALSVAILWLLRDKMAGTDIAAITTSVFQFPALRWCIAAALTALSFYAIAQYDRLVAAQMGLDLPRRLTLGAGWRATAISQVLGYGLVTGSLTRWRALGRPANLSLWDCSRLTAGVTLSFFAGWVAVASLSVLTIPLPSLQGWPTVLAMLGLAATLSICALSVGASPRWAFLIPAPRFIFPVIGFAALDTLAACAVIFVFLPEGYASFSMLYVAFLVALTAGMISGLPGGVGAFELCLMGVLAPTDPAPLLAAILAFRLIYFAAPAALAALLLILHKPIAKANTTSLLSSTIAPQALAPYAPPEAGLTVQDVLRVHHCANHLKAALWYRARNSDIVLGDVYGPGNTPTFLNKLTRAADRSGRGLCLYKCSADTADSANALGFFTLKFGSEAVLKSSSFDTKGSAFRQLRRKLRHAEQAGLSITQAGAPYSALAKIDADWQIENGPARGFSMGTLNPRLLAQQQVFVARLHDAPVGFITCLVRADCWTLDVMRIPSACPDGTAHALVIAAIQAAGDAGIETVSLATAPFYLPQFDPSISGRLVNAVFQRNAHLRGLAQFKNSFAPTWQPRYIAASSLCAIGYGVLDLWQLIRHPQRQTSNNMRTAHDHYGFYEFASRIIPCHALQRMTSKEAPHEHHRQRPLKAPCDQ